MRKITAYDKSSVKLFLAQEEAACNLINLQCSDRVKKKKKKKIKLLFSSGFSTRHNCM